MKRILFVTGTDTGVGKTVFTCLLARHLVESGRAVAALKPFCSGGREDAEALLEIQRDRLSLDEINPWLFDAPLAPLVAARKSRRSVFLKDVVAHVKTIQRKFPLVLIEGAGGLLSPLGEKFDAGDLIKTLRAVPIVVSPNRLGVVNQTRLVLRALSASAARSAQVVLVDGERPDASCLSNAKLLKEFVAPERVHVLPRVDWRAKSQPPAVRQMLTRLAKNLFVPV